MPPSACASRPSDRCCAPVNAPRSWPKSSESMSVAGIAPQSTITNGLARRALSWCTVCASRSLPVPLSPVMSTVVSVAATRRVRSSSSVIAADWNTNWLCCNAERRSCTSACRRRRSCSARTRCSSARCSRSSATASCAATPVSTGRSDLSRSSVSGAPTSSSVPSTRPLVTSGTAMPSRARPGVGRRVEATVPCRASALRRGLGHQRPLGFRDVDPAPAAPAGRRGRAAARPAGAARRRR